MELHLKASERATVTGASRGIGRAVADEGAALGSARETATGWRRRHTH